MFTLTMESAQNGTYCSDADAGRSPAVAAHSIQTAVRSMLAVSSAIYRVEPVYAGPDPDEITGFVMVGGPVRMWKELVDLRDAVGDHATAIMGSEMYCVITEPSQDAETAPLHLTVEYYEHR